MRTILLIALFATGLGCGAEHFPGENDAGDQTKPDAGIVADAGDPPVDPAWEELTKLNGAIVVDLDDKYPDHELQFLVDEYQWYCPSSWKMINIASGSLECMDPAKLSFAGSDNPAINGHIFPCDCDSINLEIFTQADVKLCEDYQAKYGKCHVWARWFAWINLDDGIPDSKLRYEIKNIPSPPNP